jgi:hypothetical protein
VNLTVAALAMSLLALSLLALPSLRTQAHIAAYASVLGMLGAAAWFVRAPSPAQGEKAI